MSLYTQRISSEWVQRETIIDKLLFDAGIPFRYEDKLVLGDNTIYPDFTVRHPRTAEYYYWEHFGLLDEPKYVSE